MAYAAPVAPVIPTTIRFGRVGGLSSFGRVSEEEFRTSFDLGTANGMLRNLGLAQTGRDRCEETVPPSDVKRTILFVVISRLHGRAANSLVKRARILYIP